MAMMNLRVITLYKAPLAPKIEGTIRRKRNYEQTVRNVLWGQTLSASSSYQHQRTVVPSMKVDEVLHMEGGQGDFSYANNSTVQRRIIAKTRPILEETVKDLSCTMLPECLTIADLGCSSGPNAFEAIWEIISVTSTMYKSKNFALPEYKVFLNDLMGNDFNTLFRSLPDFQKKLKEGNCGPCFISGAPGSFHGRLFPSNFLHFVHASSSVHFLSTVPKALVSKDGVALNKGVICVTKQSPSEVHEAYYQQFVNDFSVFLSSRSREIVPGGQMVLTFRGSTKSDKPDYIWDFELLGSALQSMVLEGKIEEDKLSSFNVPFYTPSVNEVKGLIEEDGSFSIKKLETFTIDWGLKDTDLPLTLNTRAKLVSDGYRAATGPILESQFGVTLMDDLFHRFEMMALERLDAGKLEIFNMVISMTRK